MTVDKIKLADKEIILVGTAHISKKSIELVRETIEKEKPDVVGIELDAQRYAQLKSGQRWQEMDLNSIIREGKLYLLLLNIFLSNLQRRLGEIVEVKPGMEMLAAEEEALKRGARIELLDRDVQVTLKRAFSLMPFLEKLRLLWELLVGFFSESEAITAEKIEELKKKDILTKLLTELGDKAPTVKRVLVDERDAFIAHRISQVKAKKIVAVVGAGHIDGIMQLIGKPLDERPLLVVPKKKVSLSKIILWAIPLLFAVLLGYGFFIKGIPFALHLLLYWIVITGGLSAIGAFLARAHPLSIVTAFAVAPVTTLHPLLASGWFAAAVEIKYHSPQVKDFEGLSKLNSVTDFAKNKVTHALLVAALTNIGSTIGVIVAFPYLISLIK